MQHIKAQSHLLQFRWEKGPLSTNNSVAMHENHAPNSHFQTKQHSGGQRGEFP